MTLYENWMNKAFSKDGKSMEEVWDEFLPKEQKIYEYILGEKVNVLEGAVSELALRFGVTPEEIVAFIDGINEVLPKPYDMNELEENSSVRLEIDFEKLYKKMVECINFHNGIIFTQKKKERTLQKNRKNLVRL